MFWLILLGKAFTLKSSLRGLSAKRQMIPMDAQQRLVLTVRAKLTVARTMLRLADTYKAALANPLESARAVNKARTALEAVRASLSTACLPATALASIEQELRGLEAELSKNPQADVEEKDGPENLN